MTESATTYRSHPDRGELAAYFAASLRSADAQGVERHLRAGCLRCLLTARELIRRGRDEERSTLALGLWAQAGQAEPKSSSLNEYFLKVERKAILMEVEEKVAPALVSELMLRPSAGRREVVRESRRYQLMGLSEALREESRREMFRDLARALELAELAAEVADCLETGFYDARVVADTRALAWAVVGNARRVAGDFFGAERTLRSALDLLSHGSGSPTEEAEVLSLLASLRSDQSRFREGFRLLDRVVSIYRELHLQRQEGKAIFKLGATAISAGDPGRALELFRSCLELLDPGEDAKLVFWAHHNIAACLNDSGACADARQYLESIAALYDRFSEDRYIQIQRRWLEGAIAAGLGHFEGAVDALREVRNLFVEEDRAYDNALVTLDLAAVYLEGGEVQKVKDLAREMYPVFRSQDVHRQAVAALILFEQAVAAETATAALARDVARYLTRARNNPYLRYEPAAAPVD